MNMEETCHLEKPTLFICLRRDGTVDETNIFALNKNALKNNA